MADRKKPELPPIVLDDSIGREPATTKAVSGQFLTVDETKRPRANSDPVGLHFAISILPEITVTTDEGEENGSTEDDEVDNFLVPPAPRPRANTCPEDMFQQRKERPPTPPPTDIVKSPVNRKNRFNFCHSPKELNGISFVHHKLSKVSEDGSSSTFSSNRLNGHRRHSTGRRASCLASLSESHSLLEEDEDESEVLAPVPINMSHSMNSLSLSSGVESPENSVDGETKNNPDCQQNVSKTCGNNNNGLPVLIKSCSIDVENKGSESNQHNIITSNSSIR